MATVKRSWRETRELMKRPVGEGPTGVSVVYGDGTRYDQLPTIYVERGRDAVDVYEVLLPRDPEVEKPVALQVAMWPGLTSLIFAMAGKIDIPEGLE